MNSYPAKTRYRGEVAENYLKRRAGGARWTHEQRVIERLIDSFPSGSSILDVPLGTGRFVDHYFRRGLTVYGLDISRDMLREVRTGRSGEALPEGMVHADTECIPLRDNSVDYVVCARLLNWAPMSAFKVIISEFQRVARKGVLVEVRVARALGPFGTDSKFRSGYCHESPWPGVVCIAHNQSSGNLPVESGQKDDIPQGQRS